MVVVVVGQTCNLLLALPCKAGILCWEFIIEYKGLGFCGYRVYISCKEIHIHLSPFCFLCHLLKCVPTPKWLCHQSLTHKTKFETTFFRNGYRTHHIQNSCNSLKRDDVIENIQICMWWQIFLFCLKICTNMEK